MLQVGINVLLALGYWIAVSTGKYSFGHAGFMGIRVHIVDLNELWLAAAGAMLASAATAVAGLAFGLMALRLSLLYLAIITFAFS